jgi:hypothetical protein
MLKTDEMKELINQMRLQRRKERQEEYGSVNDFKNPPVVKYKFKDLVNKYKNTGKIDL